MPFLQQIIEEINTGLKTGIFNKEKLQPANYFGLAMQIGRTKSDKKIELLPALIENGKPRYLVLESKTALQVYHKLLSNTYSYEKKSYGSDYNIKSISDISIVVINNLKMTGIASDKLEPSIIFKMPQRLKPQTISELKINSCLITPISSNMNSVEVYRQEYPGQEALFVHDQMAMFSVRYRVETVFNQACIEQCLCSNF